MNRFGRWLVRRGWIHVLLLTAVAGFLYPFLWMAFTSMKTDEELASTDVLPELPHFIAASPYVREAPQPEAPEGVDAAQWKRLEPTLIAAAEEAARQAIPADVPVDADAWARSAARVLVRQAIARVPRTAWQGDGE